jgi:hypothetical protein
MTPERLEGAGGSGGWTRRRTGHGESFPMSDPSLYQSHATKV